MTFKSSILSAFAALCGLFLLNFILAHIFEKINDIKAALFRFGHSFTLFCMKFAYIEPVFYSKKQFYCG